MTAFKFACPGCAKTVEGDPSVAGTSVVCPFCSREFKAPVLLKPVSDDPVDAKLAGDPSAVSKVRGFSEKFVGRVTEWAGEEKIEGFSFKELFSQVFSHHPSEEVEEYFTVGTATTTPPMAAVDPSWPHPWVFFRLFVGALIVYVALLMAWNQYGNLNLLPGLILVGSFAMPLSMLVFFLEANVRRNVSLYQIVRLFFAGGVLGLICALVLYQLTDNLPLQWLGAPIAGLVEEPGKLVAALLVIGSMRHRHILNGLLFGAAIGAGFAAFESSGYALRIGLQDTGAMQSNIISRGLLSPFGHIVWTGMITAALWKVMGSRKFEFVMLKDIRFLRIAAIAVGCHMIWDSPLQLPFYGTYIILGIVAWIVILALIQDGLKQLRAEKAAATAQVEPPPSSL